MITCITLFHPQNNIMRHHDNSNLINESWLTDLPKATQLENTRDKTQTQASLVTNLVE